MSSVDPERVQAVFLQAIEAPDAEAREAILQRECGSQSEFRRRVDELIAAHERSGSFLEFPTMPPYDSANQPAETMSHTRFDVATGDMIAGKYRLRELIGEGGMGTVWVAEQNVPMKRLVALKVIKPGMDSRQVLSRFDAERQALALMDHPNIAKVFDGGMTDQGRPFFVMEYVKGVPITDYCDQARLPLKQRLQLFISVCEAVEHAHHKGVIHRDLKPSNVLVCLYDERPVPKVIDFGLAKAINQPLTEHSLYTAHGAIVGTPLYMSPEQAEFNILEIDTRSDVYSLGVILYELLTGTTPLEKQRLKEAAWQEIVRLIKEEEPSKPSTKLSSTNSLPTIAANRCLEPAQLGRAVRGDLDWIVMKSLEKDRFRRYVAPVGLACDLERYLNDQPIEARPPSAIYRLHKLLRRHKVFALATAVMLLAIVVAVAGTILFHVVLPLSSGSNSHAQTDKKTRNPFKVKDVPNPDGEDVQLFARRVALAGDNNDPNAAQWVNEATPGKKGSLDGDWSTRYTDATAGAGWISGTAAVKSVGDRVYILCLDKTSTCLIDTSRVGKKLVGRYVDTKNPKDTSPWVGVIVDDERIDGEYFDLEGSRVRWNFRRKISDK